MWLVLASSVTASLLIYGVVYGYINILSQHDFGYMKMGQTISATILQTNETIPVNNLNITTTCNNANAISASLVYLDPSGITRTQPLNLDGITPMQYDFTGKLNISITATTPNAWNCTLDFQNSSVVFLNFVSGFS